MIVDFVVTWDMYFVLRNKLKMMMMMMMMMMITIIIAQNCLIVPNHCDVEKNRTKYHLYTTVLHSKQW